MLSRSRRHTARQSGFTIIEVIVALTLFAVGILATVSAANYGLRASAGNKKTVTGLNLAREGIEAVRNIRDSNWAVKARGAAPANNTWDCLPLFDVSNPTQPGGIRTPVPNCDPAQSYRMTAATSANYVLYPQLDNGLWSVRQQTAGNPGATIDEAYKLCQYTGTISDGAVNRAAPFFTPKNASAPCSDTEPGYYRRTVISRARDLGSNRYSVKVTVYVNWPGKTGGDIVLEEYLTDWRET